MRDVPAPTHARYRVVALASGLGMITYLDRACIGTLAPGIIRDLGLTTVQMGYVFTLFQLAYALFEIPTAKWADRKGTRRVLSRIVLSRTVTATKGAFAITWSTVAPKKTARALTSLSAEA